jgi:hypothetical protein
MPEISLPTKATQDLIKGDTDLIKAYVDELEGRMGINTNAAGTTTLFARLAQIAAYVDTLESDTSLIKGYTDTLEANVGSDANAASASGSVHAKIKELRNQVLAGGGTDWQAKTPRITNINTQTVSTTVIDITGSGILVSIAREFDLAILNVILDGVNVTGIAGGGIELARGLPIVCNAKFNSSLKITQSVANPQRTIVAYVLD